jgi:hypothetical protein
MIACPVCGAQNDDFGMTCVACKSYLQSRVVNINLFETVWWLIESPRSAFKKIVLAEHKNYEFFLSSMLGISLVYTVFWLKNLGHLFPNVIALAGAGLLIGPLLGVLFVLVLSLTTVALGRVFGGKATLRTMFAVIAYAATPIAISLVVVFPLEIAVFGIYFFGSNPPPIVINPIAYVGLLGFDSIACLWSWILLLEGTIVANGFSRATSLLVILSVMILTAACALILYGL